jgi:hypothetical protein
MIHAVSEIVDETASFQAGSAEIQQSADGAACCLQVIEALGSVCTVQYSRRCQFDDDGVPAQYIDRAASDDNVTEPDGGHSLLFNIQGSPAQLLDEYREPKDRPIGCVRVTPVRALRRAEWRSHSATRRPAVRQAPEESANATAPVPRAIG